MSLLSKITSYFKKDEPKKDLGFNIDLIEESKKLEPKKGEIWYFSPDDCPFDRGMNCRIIEVRSGWVNYSIGMPFNNEAMKLSLFTSIYKRK